MTVAPKTLRIQSTVRNDREVEVRAIGCTEAPTNTVSSFMVEKLSSTSRWGGHNMENTPKHLTEWSFPERVEQIRAQVQDALEEGLPEQRRVVLRNQDWGSLDERWVDDIAIGEEVEHPFQRWSQQASDTVRVAICVDTAAAGAHTPEYQASRIALAAGLASALEALDYDVAIYGGNLENPIGGASPRICHNPIGFFSVLKDEADSLTTSCFASMSDTNMLNMIACWISNGISRATCYTDREWRDLVGDVDLFINLQGRMVDLQQIPADAAAVLYGKDVLSLAVTSYFGIDGACKKIRDFFSEGDE